MLGNPKKTLQTSLKSYLEDKSINPHNKQLLQNFFEDADLDKFKRGIGERRRAKYVQLFRLLDKWFNHKPLEKITVSEFERWYLNLKTDKLIKEDGKPYSQNTKATFKVAVKTVWKWLKGNNEFFPEEVKNFRNQWENKKPEALSKSEVEKLASSFNDLRYRFAVFFLFDSGFRIDEFLTMKKRNIKLTTKSDGSEYFVAECEVSKTKPRKVAIELYTATYNQFLKEYHSTTPENAPLFPAKYNAFRKALGMHSREVLKTNVTPHRLRKSSATYFAGVLRNPYRLNKRLGWTMTSDVGNVYIDAAGINEEETVELVQSNKALELEKENIKLKARLDRLENEVKHFIVCRVKERLQK